MRNTLRHAIEISVTVVGAWCLMKEVYVSNNSGYSETIIFCILLGVTYGFAMCALWLAVPLYGKIVKLKKDLQATKDKLENSSE